MKRIAVLLILSAVLLSACTNSKWVRTPVVKQHEFIVSLEQRQDNGSHSPQQYAHPYEIELVALKKLLGDLTYTEQAGLISEEIQSPVFQPLEIDRLTPVLADTLARADASQRIRFISFNHHKAIIFSISRKTEGVLFIDSGGRLNVAFNYINFDRQPNETTAIYPNYSNIDPLKITTADTPMVPTARYANLHKFATGKQAPMWVEADLLKLKESITPAAIPSVKPTGAVSPLGATKNQSPSPVKPTTPAQAAEETFKEAEKTEPIQVSADLLREEIKDKLKYLKELMEEGLISEKDYHAKKMELLDKIN